MEKEASAKAAAADEPEPDGLTNTVSLSSATNDDVPGDTPFPDVAKDGTPPAEADASDKLGVSDTNRCECKCHTMAMDATETDEGCECAAKHWHLIYVQYVKVYPNCTRREGGRGDLDLRVSRPRFHSRGSSSGYPQTPHLLLPMRPPRAPLVNIPHK